MRLLVGPDSALVDETLTVAVRGLRPEQPVRLRVRQRNGAGGWLVSWADFEADGAGRVETARSGALRGSYTGRDAMGLFWSLVRDSTFAPEPGAAPVGEPSVLAPGVQAALPTAVDLLDESGRVLASRAFTRLRVAPGVRRTEVRSDGLVATLYEPAGRRSRSPGVLVLGGSDGSLAATEAKAAAAASRGVTALALAYFAQPGLPESLAEVPVEYAERALDHLKGRPGVDPRRIAIWGESKGSELALLVASRRPDVRSVVAMSPMFPIWEAPPRFPARGQPTSSWSAGGKPLPFVPFSHLFAQVRDPAEVWTRALGDTAAVRRADIPVERIAASLLLVSGNEDRICPCSRFADEVERRARSRRGAPSVTHLSYAGAGHFFLPGHLPTRIRIGPFDPGGEPAAIARASADAWPRILQALGGRAPGR